MDIKVESNAFGRQVDSFEIDLPIPCLKKVSPSDAPFHAIFIRAPLIEEVGKGVEVLASLQDGRIVAAHESRWLATSFHPELTADDRVDRYFLEMFPLKSRPSPPLDLVILFKHRDHILWLNPEQLLLHGSANLFARVGLETLVGGGSWFTQSLRAGALRSCAYGQVEKNHQRARINLLLVLDQSNDSCYLRMIDNLSFEAGLHGAKFLLASVEKDSAVFPLLRRAGFCFYGWERFWRMKPLPLKLVAEKTGIWEKPSAGDVHEYHKFRNKQLRLPFAPSFADGRSPAGLCTRSIMEPPDMQDVPDLRKKACFTGIDQ